MGRRHFREIALNPKLQQVLKVHPNVEELKEFVSQEPEETFSSQITFRLPTRHMSRLPQQQDRTLHTIESDISETLYKSISRDRESEETDESLGRQLVETHREIEKTLQQQAQENMKIQQEYLQATEELAKTREQFHEQIEYQAERDRQADEERQFYLKRLKILLQHEQELKLREKQIILQEQKLEWERELQERVSLSTTLQNHTETSVNHKQNTQIEEQPQEETLADMSQETSYLSIPETAETSFGLIPIETQYPYVFKGKPELEPRLIKLDVPKGPPSPEPDFQIICANCI